MSRAAGAMAVVAVVAGAACIPEPLVRGDPPTANPNATAPVFDEVERLRRLPFTRDVPVEVKTLQDVQVWVDEWAARRQKALERSDRFHQRMGLLRPTQTTAGTTRRIVTEFVGGLYDEAGNGGDGTMILVKDYAWWSKIQQDAVGQLTGVDWAYELFLAHELVHALQDQHFDLDVFLSGGVYDDNDDAAFVRKTILESEANVVGMAHFFGMDLEGFASRKAFFALLRYNHLLSGPLMTAIAGDQPSFFTKRALAQYELGLTFVERKLDRGGFDELSKSYLRVPGEKGALPESTEQLLWPRSDAPRHLAPLPAPPAPLDDKSFIGGDVFGALSIRLWLEVYLSGGAASDAARGWGGDRWELVDDDGTAVLLWRSTWDSEDDARQFAAAALSVLSKKGGERATRRAGAGATDASDDDVTLLLPAAPDEERFHRALRDEASRVVRRGQDVVIVDGARPEQLDALTQALLGQLQPVARPALNVEALSQARARLDEALPPPPPDEPRLAPVERLFAPRRIMVVRLGTGIGVDEINSPGQSGLRPPRQFGTRVVPDVEMRWGFREGLELSTPFALTGKLDSPFGQTTLGSLLPLPLPYLRAGLALSHAVPLGDRLAVVAQGSARLEVFNYDVAGGVLSPRAAAGAVLQPHPRLTLLPGAALVELTGLPQQPAREPLSRQLVVGAALERGFVQAPLVELEVVDIVHLYESSTVTFDVGDGGLRPVAQTHVVGVLVAF